MIPTLLRKAEHQALSMLTLDGTILDLGGDARSDYRKLIQGTHAFTTVNLDTKAVPDISHNLEQPLPIETATYDHTLMINVLEHIFNFRQLLTEAARVTKPGGQVVIVVPFLFPIHPSPNDYWRLSASALEKECETAGLVVSETTALGSGVFAAQFVMIDRLLPLPLRILGLVFRPIILLLDTLFTHFARICGKKYDPSDYALGYFIVAHV